MVKYNVFTVTRVCQPYDLIVGLLYANTKEEKDEKYRAAKDSNINPALGHKNGFGWRMWIASFIFYV